MHEAALKDLQMICDKWQDILRLNDWKITVKFSRWHELGDSNYLAQVSYMVNTKRAVIEIIHPDDFRPQCTDFGEPDLEKTIVHELLHLPTFSWDTQNPHADLLKEQFIEQMANILTTLKRRIA